MDPLEPEEHMFARELCPIDRQVASLKIADSRICLSCYHNVKKISHLDFEEIEALTLARIQEFLDKKPETVTLRVKEPEHEPDAEPATDPGD